MNNLKNITEFRQTISVYEPSIDSKDLLKKVNLTLLVAPSSTGRNTTINELVKKDQFQFIVTDTTRKTRINDGILETNGVEYFFKTEEEFLDGLKNGDYLEAEVIHNQQVSGISIRELRKAYENNKYAVTDVDIGGIEAILKYKSDAHIIMLLPPSFDEWLKRLNGRGKMMSDEIRRRMETALRIFQAGLERNYFNYVINVDYVDSAETINDISVHGIDPKASKEQAKELINRLILDTKNYLETKIT
jgi:guanylate kinase